MPAKKGNKYYLERSVDGRKKDFETPSELWDAFIEYIEWSKNNPWVKYEVIKSGKDMGKLITIPIEKPLSLLAFSNYCGLTKQGLYNYGEKESYKEYFDIFTRIKGICENQKIEGSEVGCYNANIVARVLGLADKTENKTDLSVSKELEILLSKFLEIDR